jgi:hypothetical protein
MGIQNSDSFPMVYSLVLDDFVYLPGKLFLPFHHHAEDSESMQDICYESIGRRATVH